MTSSIQINAIATLDEKSARKRAKDADQAIANQISKVVGEIQYPCF